MGDTGAQILDVRDAAEYAKGHLAGSINIGLGGQYATWAGTVLDRAKPIVIIAEPGREQEAALRLGRIGFDHVKRLPSGTAWRRSPARPDLVWPTERVSVLIARRRAGSQSTRLVLDIRAPANGRASTSTAASTCRSIICRNASPRIPRDRRIAVHCAGGYRSSIAASILQQSGFTNLVEIAGGLAAWEAAGLPVVAEA